MLADQGCHRDAPGTHQPESHYPATRDSAYGCSADPISNGFFQLPWIIVVLQLDHVLHGSVVAFDLTLGLRVIWGATGVLDVLAFKPSL